jgi:CDP-glucose 4,6-dehydratase
VGGRQRAVEVMGALIDAGFWRGTRVLLTGHTGFVGGWTALWLEQMGAQVTGLALPPEGDPNLFELLSPWPELDHRIADLRDAEALARAVSEVDPQVVIHLAAQALVPRSYRRPLETLTTNVMGTAHLLDSLRGLTELAAVLVITSDKVYLNHERAFPFGEGDPLGGHDPYSASKAAQEHVALSFGRSYLAGRGVALATARAGNLIGGGDWGVDRLIPDLWRAARDGRAAPLRNPGARRPWLHVLDAVAGYLAFARRLADAEPGRLPGTLNLGPREETSLTVGELATRFLSALEAPAGWEQAPGDHPPEKRTLALDSTLARATLGWRPQLDADAALGRTADWYRAHADGEDMRAFSLSQISTFLGDSEKGE